MAHRNGSATRHAERTTRCAERKMKMALPAMVCIGVLSASTLACQLLPRIERNEQQTKERIEAADFTLAATASGENPPYPGFVLINQTPIAVDSGDARAKASMPTKEQAGIAERTGMTTYEFKGVYDPRDEELTGWIVLKRNDKDVTESGELYSTIAYAFVGKVVAKSTDGGSTMKGNVTGTGDLTQKSHGKVIEKWTKRHSWDFSAVRK